MGQPTLESGAAPRRRGAWSRFIARRPFGLPLFELTWGVLLLIGLLAALSLAIWSALVNGTGEG
jgi:hypothetical protein